MTTEKKMKSYEELLLVLNVTDIQNIMGISRVNAYELVYKLGFPAIRSSRLIKVKIKAFFDWMQMEETYDAVEQI